jgi:lipopolysaccharide transport system permease protein
VTALTRQQPESMVRTLLHRRDVLFMLAWRDIKIKYKQSVMGFFWAILMPLVIVSAGVIVRFAFARLSGSQLYAADLAIVTVKAVPWAFFVSAIRFASNSLIANTSLVTKIYMPREIFPLASILSQLVDFAVAAVVAGLFLLVVRPTVTTSVLWIPLFVALLILLAAGCGIFLSAAALFFRDVKYIVEVILTFAIFFTPVFYEVRMFGDWATALLLNPVAPLLEGIGAAAVGQPLPAAGWLLYSAATAILGFVGAMAFFKKLEPLFAEAI